MMSRAKQARTIVPRRLPPFVVLLSMSLVVGPLAGFLLAAWTLTGISPAYTAGPAVARAEPRSMDRDDDWREAGYARIGLWEPSRADDRHADGSSRL
jgi:hypothetical protein